MGQADYGTLCKVVVAGGHIDDPDDRLEYFDAIADVLESGSQSAKATVGGDALAPFELAMTALGIELV